MVLSGPNQTWKTGKWDLQLPVLAWRAWLADGSEADSGWADLPDRILAVCVYHERGRRTWMSHVDEYPCPDGDGPTKLGEQMGPLNCVEWLEFYKQIRADPWRPNTG